MKCVAIVLASSSSFAASFACKANVKIEDYFPVRPRHCGGRGRITKSDQPIRVRPRQPARSVLSAWFRRRVAVRSLCVVRGYFWVIAYRLMWSTSSSCFFGGGFPCAPQEFCFFVCALCVRSRVRIMVLMRELPGNISTFIVISCCALCVWRRVLVLKLFARVGCFSCVSDGSDGDYCIIYLCVSIRIREWFDTQT